MINSKRPTYLQSSQADLLKIDENFTYGDSKDTQSGSKIRIECGSSMNKKVFSNQKQPYIGPHSNKKQQSKVLNSLLFDYNGSIKGQNQYFSMNTRESAPENKFDKFKHNLISDLSYTEVEVNIFT